MAETFCHPHRNRIVMRNNHRLLYPPNLLYTFQEKQRHKHYNQNATDEADLKYKSEQTETQNKRNGQI